MHHFAFFFVLSCLWRFGEAQQCSSFKVYWAFTGPSTCDPSSPPLDNSTAGLPYLFEPSSQFIIKHNPAATLLPYCVTQADGSITSFNGGVPQNATSTLGAYLRALEAELSQTIPANWSGVGAFDFPFQPDLTFPDQDPCVSVLSSDLVKAVHPEWNASQVQAEATLQFNNASFPFFATALQAGRTISKGRWGFLGLPLSMTAPCLNQGLNPQCGYHHPTAGPAQKAINNENGVSHITDFSGALFPTIELSLGQGKGEWASRNKDSVYGVVEQARRGNNYVGWAILPVLSARYADAPTAELLSEDLAMVLTAVVQAGGNGLVIQGNPYADAPSKACGFFAYLASTLGPAVLSSVTDNCACAMGSCSDGGNCVGLVAGPECTPPVACAVPAAGLGARAPACVCSPRKQGATCNETAKVDVAMTWQSAAAAASSSGSQLGLARIPGPRPGASFLETARAGALPGSAAAAAAATAPALPPVAPGCPSVPQDAHFPLYWNIVDQATVNKSGPMLDNSTLADLYLFTAGNQTRTGAIAGDYMPSCRSFFNKTANETQIQSFNGGIPQLANLSLLLDAVRDQVAGNFTSPKCHPTPTAPCKVTGWGLQPDFEGNAVFDFETWRPVFVGQWNDECMTNLSVAKVMQENPTWTNTTQIFQQAELEFETAAMDIFVGMLDTGKAIAPKAKWGFYGYPANLFYYCVSRGDDPQCGYHNDYVGGMQQKWFNDNKYQKVR